jgi:hypothetical protein
MTPRHSRRKSDQLRRQVIQGLELPAPRGARPRLLSLDTPLLSGQAHSIAGTSGVAYAGGASSGPVSRSPTQLVFSSLPKGSTLERVRRNSTTCGMDRETWEPHHRGSVQRDPPQMIPAQQPTPKLEFQRTDFPGYLFPLREHSDYPTSSNPRDRELRSPQAASLPPSPPSPRQNAPCTESLRSAPPSVARLTTQSPTGQPVKARIPDKSLPVKEEDDEDDACRRNANQEQVRDRWTPSRGEQPTHRREQGVSDPGREHLPVFPPTPLSDPVAGYYHRFPHSPHSRPGAPIPPTSHSYTSAPSVWPLISGMNCADGMKPVLPPYSPAQHTDSLYPYPFAHIRCGVDNGVVDLSQVDPSVVREQLALQMQINAINKGGIASDSVLSPSSTPFPAPQYNPWTFIQTSNAFGGRRGDTANSQASMHSSPSHQPVPLQPFSRRSREAHRRERSQGMRRQPMTCLPSRVDSTQPWETNPDFSSGEETVGEFNVGERQSEPRHSATQQARWGESADGEDEPDEDDWKWIDEDVGIEGSADDLLQLEFHTDYVGDPEKRHRRWNLRWETLLHNVSAPTVFALRSVWHV